MDKHQIPLRPNVSDEVALEGLERLVGFMLNEIAAAKSSPVTFIQEARMDVVDGASEAQGPQARQVADYMDWMLAMSELAMRRRGP